MIIKDLFGNVLQFQFTGSVTKDEHELITMYEKGNATVYLILDLYVYGKIQDKINPVMSSFAQFTEPDLLMFETSTAVVFWIKKEPENANIPIFKMLLLSNIKLD